MTLNKHWYPARNAKGTVKQLLSVQPINRALLALLRQPMVRDHVSPSVLGRIPVVSTVHVVVDEQTSFLISSDGSDSIANHLYWARSFNFEVDTCHVFRTLLPHATTVVDIGANTGIFTLLAGVSGDSTHTRRIFAFEPVPRICNALRRNVALNHLPNVVAEGCALTDFDGAITLYIPADVMYPTGASTLEGLRPAVEAIEVPAIRLDTYFTTGPGRAASHVDLMKIDTEATEPAVLSGGVEILRRDHPFIICEVLPGRTEAQLEPLLSQLGYQFFWITERGIEARPHIVGDTSERFLNYLFAAPDRMAALAAACDRPRFEDCFDERHL